MRQCLACGAQVSERENTCPQCGAPLSSVTPQYTGEKKDKMIAALLAFFLGGLGVHYFYLGKTTAGIICILITWLTCGLGAILPLVNFIGLLVASDEHFENEWLNPDKTFPVW